MFVNCCDSEVVVGWVCIRYLVFGLCVGVWGCVFLLFEDQDLGINVNKYIDVLKNVKIDRNKG